MRNPYLLILSLYLLSQVWSISDIDLSYSQQLKQLCNRNNLTFFNDELITTIKGNSIQVFGISADHTKRLYADFMGSSAILITGAMHPRQDTSFRFIKQAIEHIVTQYGRANPQIVYLLQKVTLLVIPFVNIDAIKQSLNLTQKQSQDIRKNMNYYNSQKCRKKTDRGVDINRNFDYNYGKLKTSTDPCGQEYRGKQPFSQSQSQAIRRLFEQFHITTNVDVHSYGNLWIYPYASQPNPDKIKQHKLYPFYQTIFQEFKVNNVQYDNCYESLKYVADGVYIDWALYKNSVSFALQFGDTFDTVGKQMQKHIKALITVMNININYFKKYYKINYDEQKKLTRPQQQQQQEQNKKWKYLCLESFSTLEHNVILILDDVVTQGKRLPSRHNVCFEYNFKKPQSQKSQQPNNRNKVSKILIKIGKSNIYIDILPQQVQIIKQVVHNKKDRPQKDQNKQSFLIQLWDQFKYFFITVGVLYLIGSLCGLSIFCENALGLNLRQEQQANQLTQQQINEMQEVQQVLDTVGQFIKQSEKSNEIIEEDEGQNPLKNQP